MIKIRLEHNNLNQRTSLKLELCEPILQYSIKGANKEKTA
jgi:hypothetical protein